MPRPRHDDDDDRDAEETRDIPGANVLWALACAAVPFLARTVMVPVHPPRGSGAGFAAFVSLVPATGVFLVLGVLFRNAPFPIKVVLLAVAALVGVSIHETTRGAGWM